MGDVQYDFGRQKYEYIGIAREFYASKTIGTETALDRLCRLCIIEPTSIYRPVTVVVATSCLCRRNGKFSLRLLAGRRWGRYLALNQLRSLHDAMLIIA